MLKNYIRQDILLIINIYFGQWKIFKISTILYFSMVVYHSSVSSSIVYCIIAEIILTILLLVRSMKNEALWSTCD